MAELDSIVWSFEVLQAFKDDLVGFSFGRNDIDKEIALKRQEYLQFSRNQKKYLLSLDLEDKLPIKVVETQRLTYRNYVFNKITNFKSIRIRPNKTMEFDELILNFSNFKHTNERDWLLWKLLVFSGYNTRVNLRVATNPYFGKNSVVQSLGLLTSDVSVFHPKSMASIEYRLGNRLMAIDEVGTVVSESNYDFQDFLLLAGDLRPEYHKPTRGNKQYNTRDVYDIKNMSLFLMYNDMKTYKNAGIDHKAKYFDYVVSGAVLNRILPIKLSGTLYSGQFDNLTGEEEAKEIAQQNKAELVNYLVNIEYYKLNWLKELRTKKMYNINIPQMLQGSRQHSSFNRFARILNLFADGKDDFQELVNLLWERVVDYHKMMDADKTNGNTGFGAFEKQAQYDEKVEVFE